MESVEKSRQTVFLVGTCHRDLQGFNRSRRLLEVLRPDVVLVEVSPFAVRIRQKHGRFFLKLFRNHLKRAAALTSMSPAAALRTLPVLYILRQLTLPFEFRAVRRWSADAGRPYFCADFSEASRVFVLDWPEMVSLKNLENLLRRGLDTAVPASEEYRRARAALTDPPLRRNRSMWGKDDAVWENRERWLEKAVRRTLHVLHPHRLVYLGGWAHVVPNGGRSLRDRLRDLKPRSVLLEDADRPTPLE